MLNPMFAMVILTFAVGCIALFKRFSAVKQKHVSIKYFKIMKSEGEIPESLVQSTRQFNNLFETPVLFYTAGLGYLALGLESQPAIIVAWLYVASRCAHCAIHLSYNNILHRMLTFWFSFLCILALWAILIISAR